MIPETSVFLNLLVLGLSIFVLARSAGLLVDGSVGLASLLHVPKLVIGIVLVSFATTAPEFTVTVIASLDGVADRGFAVALSRGGTKLYVSVPWMGRIMAVDLATRTRAGVIGTGCDPRRMAFDTTGETLVVANQAGWVDIIR